MKSENLFLKNGTSFHVTSRGKMDLHEVLPAGNYVINKDMRGELFLEQIDSFEVSGRIYGDVTRHTHRILATFEDRPAATGVMLAGEKGSGKSLLGKNICVEAAKKGVPTIVINAPWCGDQFNSFIQQITQPCIVLFDEFEKVYDDEHQQAILTLLDGVFPSKKLFILTSNDKWKLNTHMRNRPGRIFYMLDFSGLGENFIREYCEDKLNDKSHIDQICKIASIFDSFNFDMIKALVEEMNRFNEAPQQAMEMLNTKPEFSNKVQYDVKLVIDGKEIEEESMYEKEWSGNPLLNPIQINYYFKNPKYTGPDDEENAEYEDETLVFNAGDLKKIESNNDGRFVFRRGDKSIILTRPKVKTFSYYDAL